VNNVNNKEQMELCDEYTINIIQVANLYCLI